MEIKLKVGQKKITRASLIDEIRNVVQKLPEGDEKDFINRNLGELKLAWIIDLINTLHDWCWNGKYSHEGKIRSYLFDIHNSLKQLEKIIKSEEFIEELLKLAQQLPNSDERDTIITSFKEGEINEESLKSSSDYLEDWLDNEMVGEFEEEEQDTLLRIEKIIEELSTILEEN